MSCFCRAIELNNNSTTSNSCCCVNSDCVRSGYERIMSCAALTAGSSLPKTATPVWKTLWTKMKREKRRLFDCSSSVAHVVPYDPESYSQNFDQGGSMADPENLSRSFSARFAVPLRVFQES